MSIKTTSLHGSFVSFLAIERNINCNRKIAEVIFWTLHNSFLLLINIIAHIELFIRKKFFQALSEFYQECLFSFSCLNLMPSFSHQSLEQSQNRVCLLQTQGYLAGTLHRLFLLLLLSYAPTIDLSRWCRLLWQGQGLTKCDERHEKSNLVSISVHVRWHGETY